MILEALPVVERAFRDPAVITKAKPVGYLLHWLYFCIKMQKNFVRHKQLICIKNAQFAKEIL